MLPGRHYTASAMLDVVRRRKWSAIVPLFACVLGALLYSRLQPDLYRSQAIVQVVPQRVPESYIQSTVTERVEDRLRALAQQVLSRTQLEQIILDFNLYPKERASEPMEEVVELMTKRVEIAPLAPEKSVGRQPAVDAFRVSFAHDDPRVAQKVVERLSSYFIDRNAKERGTQAEQTSQFLDAQLADARARLEAQEQKLEAFRERNAGRLPTQMQTNMQAVQNTQLTLQALVESLARDRDRKSMLERLYADASSDVPAAAPQAARGGTPNDPTAGVPVLASPQQRLDAARAALVQLELRLTPKHPDVVRARRLVDDLEKQVAAQETQRPLDGSAPAAPVVSPEEARHRDKLREMRAEIESLERQIAFKESEERNLRAQIALYQSRLEAVPGIESEWIALTRDYDTLQEAYKELLSKSENSKLAANLEQRQIGEQFSILDAPRVPELPFEPNRLRISAVGLVSGIVLALVLLWWGEYRDSTMRTEHDVFGALDLPVLVQVPYVPIQADVRRTRRRQLLTSLAVAVVCVATGALVWVLQLWKYVV